MAIGSAKIMGFTLMSNSHRPYFLRNIAEFWKRWHFSLSTWFKDYLYISLGGNRVGIPRWYLNLFLVFTISGLWHGANWTYIIWGAINGFYLVFAIISQDWRKAFAKLIYLDRLPKLNNFVQIILTFILACFAWIFFRANNVQGAFLIVERMVSDKGTIYIGEMQQIILSLFAIAMLLFFEVLQEYKFKSQLPIRTNHWLKETVAYAGLVILILMLGVFDGGQFIYFQF